MWATTENSAYVKAIFSLLKTQTIVTGDTEVNAAVNFVLHVHNTAHSFAVFNNILDTTPEEVHWR